MSKAQQIGHVSVHWDSYYMPYYQVRGLVQHDGDADIRKYHEDVAKVFNATIETTADRDRLKKLNAELLEAMELALLSIDSAIDLAQRCEDETFIAHALTRDKVLVAIAKAKSQ